MTKIPGYGDGVRLTLRRVASRVGRPLSSLPRRLAVRRERLPDEVGADLGLAPGEHVIAHARTAHGPFVVATDQALHIPGDQGYRRLGWDSVARASWEGGVLHVTEAGAPGSQPARHTLDLVAPGLLPDTVHDRVTSTIVVNRHVPLRGTAGVRIIGRRRPGRHDSTELEWSMAFDAGVDPADADVRAAATAALDNLREQLGL